VYFLFFNYFYMLNGKKVRGFTLIEILVVVALIAILAAITFIAINPAKNFADTRNAQRSSDVLQILNAVTQYTSEQGHNIADFGTIALCTATPDHVGTDPANVNLATLLVDTYIVGIPKDPGAGGTVGTDADTQYTICRTAGNRVQVDAPLAENSKIVTVKR
jgi:prepilin-type N-terminal cleavage/methylation domain-containing protein